MTITRRAIVLATLALIAGSREGAGQGRVIRDSVRIHVTNAHAERARVAKRLLELESQMNSDSLGREQRARVKEEMANLTLQLSELGSRFAVELVPRLEGLAPLIEMEVREGLRETRAAMMLVQPREVLRQFAPKGWLGINVDGRPQEIMIRDGDLLLRFAEFPRVVSVDPNSPAQRAGVKSGDLVMAYDGKDVRTRLSMGSILMPGKRVSVRVRRDGGDRELGMVVATAPTHSTGRLVDQMAPMPPAEPRVVRAAPLPRPAREASVDSVAVSAREFEVWRTPGAYSFSTVRNPAFVGAQLERVTDEMSEVVRVKRGVIVLRLLPGTPAEQAGLKQFDVIVRAGDRDVSSPTELYDVVRALNARANLSEVVLEVLRGGAKRKVTVRWQ